MHVLILGAAGMIGRKLGQNLAQNGRLGSHEIEALTLVDVTPAERPAGFSGRVAVAALDIGDPGAVAAVIAKRPDVIFHLAAVVSAEAEADLEKGYRVNLDGSRSVLEAVRREGETRALSAAPRFRLLDRCFRGAISRSGSAMSSSPRR